MAILKSTGNTDIDNYLQRLLDAKRSSITVQQYWYFLADLVRHIPKAMKDITILDLLDYNTVLAKKVNPDTHRTHLVVIKKYFRELGTISDYDLKKILLPRKENKLPEYLTHDESFKLLEQAKYDLRNYAILSVFLYEGLRLSELINLNVPDIDFNDGIMKVRCGKGKKDRILPIADQVRKSIIDYLKYREDKGIKSIDGSDALFISNQFKRMSKTTIRVLLKRYSLKAGYNGRIYPHKLRHTALTQIYQHSRDIYFTSKLAGHSNLNMTQIYTHLDTDYLKSAYKKANIDYGHEGPKPIPKETTMPGYG